MAGSITNYSETAILGHVFGSTTFTKPSSLYLALYTVAPGEAGGGTEVSTSGTGYARQLATFTISGSSPAQAANTAAIEFPVATASWGTVVAAAILDASTAGNMISFATLSADKTVSAGDVLRFNIGSVVVTLD